MPIAKSLEKLLAELNAEFPNRSKVSDGAYGDAAHAKRKSDHNPNGLGYVTARDFTHNEGEGGINGHQLLSALLKSKDPRIKYIIFFSKIYNVKNGFAPKPYSGINAHKHHLHLSVSVDPALYNDASDWNLQFDGEDAIPQPSEPVQSDSIDFGETKEGDSGPRVTKIQQRLLELGYLQSASGVDGDFGPNTTKAVKSFQNLSGLRIDGIVGRNTWNSLFG